MREVEREIPVESRLSVRVEASVIPRITLQVVGAVAIALGLVLWPVFLSNEFYTHIAILVLLSIIGAVGLHLVMRTGRLSLGQAAFFGIGAYASALLMMKAHAPFLVALIGGAVLPGLLALVVGPIILRLQGVYFALLTFALGEVVQLVLTDAQPITGGSNGIFGIPVPIPLLASHTAYYYFVLIATAICVGFAYLLVHSQVGRALDSIGEADNLAEAAGMPTLRFRVLAFVIAAMMLGIQGSLLAHYLGYIAPDLFGFNASLMYVAANVVGGTGSIVGPIIGSVFLVPLPEFLRDFVQYQQILYGVILLVVVSIAPNGLIDGARRKFRVGKQDRREARLR